MSASKTRRAQGNVGQGCCKGQRQRTLKDSKMSARPELELKQTKLACREGCVQGGKGGASVTETETGSSCLLTLKCQLMRHTKMLEYNGHALCALFSSHSLSLSLSGALCGRGMQLWRHKRRRRHAKVERAALALSGMWQPQPQQPQQQWQQGH